MGGEISASSSSATPAPTSTGSKASTANTPNNTTPKSTPTLTSQNGRPLVCGPDELELPYPVLLKGDVCKGFGRGSKELGIPTANLPSEVAESAGKALDTGIYYGFASVGNGLEVWPMVMSFGWNPYYKNERRSAEVHILHVFANDFYGQELRVIVAGFIRAEKDYHSLDALIGDIQTDIQVAQTSLTRPAYLALKNDAFLLAA